MAGNAYKITDPRGLVTQYSFDLLGRTTQEVDGASGSPATGEGITNWTYDGDNNILTMQAVFPGTSTPSETTQYVYGVGTTSGSGGAGHQPMVSRQPAEAAGVPYIKEKERPYSWSLIAARAATTPINRGAVVLRNPKAFGWTEAESAYRTDMVSQVAEYLPHNVGQFSCYP